MSGYAEAIYRVQAPVLGVVTRLMSGPSEVRDLVLLIFRIGECVDHDLVHLGGKIVVRSRATAAADLLCQWCTGVDLQNVKREVLGREENGLLKVAFPLLDRLPGQSGYQVK